MLHFNRQELLSSDEAARLRELAKHILQEIGMNACHAGALDQLRREGFLIRGSRVLFESTVLEK
jgi:trimethylamine:corrinoid methyltransferase-like protein